MVYRIRVVTIEESELYGRTTVLLNKDPILRPNLFAAEEGDVEEDAQAIA